MVEETLVLIKPDGVARSLTGEILRSSLSLPKQIQMPWTRRRTDDETPRARRDGGHAGSS